MVQQARVQAVLLGVDEDPVAIVVTSLPDQTIQFASATAVELPGYPRADVVGRRAHDFMVKEDAPLTDIGMSALAAGVCDSYQASRHLRRGDGSVVDVSIWVRALDDPPSCAVSILLPADADRGLARTVARLFGPDATDLAVGMMDQSSRVVGVCADAGLAPGGADRSLVGHVLADLVHPDDAEDFRRGLRRAVETGDDVMVSTSMRTAGEEWTPVSCVVFREAHTPDGQLAFALAAASADEGESRAHQLERHLMRIGAELRSAGLLTGVRAAVDPLADADSLSDLSERQHEIVERLLQGERVPGIAEDMHLSPATVRNHLTRVFEKFGVHSQAEMIKLLRRKPGAAADG
jgi:PAS domain S-box-containing protein